jgi:alpha,alpha-trehalase
LEIFVGLYGGENPQNQRDLQVSRFGGLSSEIPPADTLTPADRYQELFIAVQTQRIFEDSKTFVDCVPRRHPEQIMEAYRTSFFKQGFDLEAFVHEHFKIEEEPPNCFVSDPDRALAKHIEALWPGFDASPRGAPGLIIALAVTTRLCGARRPFP